MPVHAANRALLIIPYSTPKKYLSHHHHPGHIIDWYRPPINVTNVDEVAPTITSGDTATAIDENSGAGQVI